MGSRKVKKEILLLLTKSNWTGIKKQLSRYNESEIVSPLFSALCSTDELSKWHAVSSFGLIVTRLAHQNIENARIIMRRFLWSLNDESGGIGWGAPEAMAEIMVHSDILFSEYIHMLISYMRGDGPELLQDGNFLELPALQRGVIWGIGRLLIVRNDEMLARGVTADLRAYLNSPDKIVQGLAAWCLGMCRENEVMEDLLCLSGVTQRFNLYLDGTLTEVGVAELALNSVTQLQNS